MNTKMNAKRSLLVIVLSLIVFVFLAGTLAYWIWTSEDQEMTAVSTTIIGNSSCSILVDGGGEIDASSINMVPSTCDDKTATIVKEIDISVEPGESIKNVLLELYLKIDSMGTPLRNSENFRYVLSKSNSCYTDVVESGSFKYATNDKVKILSETYMSTSSGPTSDKYYLHIWLDEKETDVNTAGNEFSLSLSGICNDTDISSSTMTKPILDDGLIPVTIANTGTVKSISSSSPNWYNYNEKKWANAVLVSDGNSSTSAYDLSGNNTSNTINGATYANNGLSFDGTDDTVTFPVINVADKSGFTIETEFSIDSYADEQEFIFANLENAGFGLKYINGQLGFQIYDNDAGDYVRLATEPDFLLPGVRYNAVGVYDGNSVSLYVNGELIEQKSMGTPKDHATTVTMLGCNPSGTGCGGEYFKGTIYSARFYNKALSSNEVLDNYNKSITMDNLLFYFDFENGKRSLYKNFDNVVIPESEILAYYVWIPKYSYKIPTGTGPRTIDIQFDSLNTSMNEGDAVNTYRTHPAFWWDYNSDGDVDNGEVVPGFWVGKFETTGDGTIPTVKPNASALVSQDVGVQFATSLKFAGGIQSGSSVSFTGNNTYGLTANTDSHMMKNSEWGAVAYLSHSMYGINGEIRINNTNGHITGCGASTENAAGSNDCEIAYGLSTSSYPQSTTGNITGIFDMSGGAWDVVMANFDNSIYSTSISNLPDSKYYDVYLSSDFTGDYVTNFDLCTLETCGGHSLFETFGWYNDFNYMLMSGYYWMLRGGNNIDSIYTGIFSSSVFTGMAESYYSWRSVLIPDASKDNSSSAVSGTVTATSNWGSEQTVTLSWNNDVVSYYWGKEHPYSPAISWIDVTGTNGMVNVPVSEQGTYYLGLKYADNFITIVEKDFYMTEVVLSNISTSLPTNVLTMEGNKITLPNLTASNGYTFFGWYTGENATGEKLNKTYTPQSSTRIYSYSTNKIVTVRYYVDGGTVNASTSDGFSSYSWSQDTSGLISLDGAVYTSVFGYEQQISFPSNSNSKFLNVTKQYYGPVAGAEWACVDGCKTSGATFDVSNVYSVSDICDTTSDTCTINLKVNWELTATVINANRFTAVTANSLKRLVVFYVTMCQDGKCEYTKKYGLTSGYSSSKDFDTSNKAYSGTIDESTLSSSATSLGVKTYTYYAKASNGCRTRADKDYDTGMYSFPSGCKSYTFYLTGYLSVSATTANDNQGIYRYMWYNTKSCYVWRNNLYTSSSC